MFLSLPSDQQAELLKATKDKFEKLSGEEMPIEKVALLCGIFYGLLHSTQSSAQKEV